MENYRDVWSWIKIIAVWFEENIYLKFITYMEITKKFIERHSIFRQWYFLVVWSNTYLLLQSQILAYCFSHKSVIVEGDSKGIWSVHGPRLLEHAADSVTQIHCPEVTTVLPCPDNWFQHYMFYSIWTHLKIWIKVLLAIWGFLNNGMQLNVYKNSNIHYLSLHFKIYRLYLTSVTEIWQSFLTPV